MIGAIRLGWTKPDRDAIALTKISVSVLPCRLWRPYSFAVARSALLSATSVDEQCGRSGPGCVAGTSADFRTETSSKEIFNRTVDGGPSFPVAFRCPDRRGGAAAPV